jgi:uncharacterized OB-fold protein
VSGARLVDTSLFAGGDSLALAGSRCRTCSTVTFPQQTSCPRCAGVDVEVHALSTEGTIWAFTEQLFPPKEPYAVQGPDFRPFLVGYVDLAGEVIVEARLVAAPGTVHIGQRVRLVTEAFTPAGDVLTYAFAPEESPES